MTNSNSQEIFPCTPIVDGSTGRFIRNLTYAEADDTFITEHNHGNIRAVYANQINGVEHLSYVTREMKYNTITFNHRIKYPKGHLGVIDVHPDVARSLGFHLHKMACCYAINAGFSYDDSTCVFTILATAKKWKVVPESQADCSITLRYEGDILGTVHFRRLWPGSVEPA